VRPAGAWRGEYLRIPGNQCGATPLRSAWMRCGAVRRREQTLVAKLLAMAGLQLAIITAQREGLGQIAGHMAVARIVENGEHLLGRVDEDVERVAHRLARGQRMRLAVRDHGNRWAAGIRAELGGVGLDEIDMALISPAPAYDKNPPALRPRELPPQLGKRGRGRH